MVESSSNVGSDNNDTTALQIDMKWLVGDAVGNMSISPTNRDIVLATRKGLFIIDLDAPLEVPRFLPQGGTWDVADVQWNPHISHANYIVSTSSEKLLIWNLLLDEKMSIEHILHSHYRAINDINWHPTDPNLVVSTGIDSWLWTWDLRTTQKPILGLCAFTGGGTQVKWNRQDENILASSHTNQILIWDRRKGSLPISCIDAHAAKIYGIDWSYDRRNEIVTCSLDRTIKVFDLQSPSQPKITFHTSYPVWRARDLPFGRGILSLPQRGENALDMFAHDNPETPIQVFEGHTDVVKEFVWRRGGQDFNEFQLITWSRDKTLRFWPINDELVQKTGPKPVPPTPLGQSNILDGSQASYPKQSRPAYHAPPLSAPVGHILAEVRSRPQPLNLPFRPVPRDGSPPIIRRSMSQVRKSFAPLSAANKSGNTMTRGSVGGKSSWMDTLTWWSSVKVGDKREGSSEPGSDHNGEAVSRVNSRSRRNSKSNGQEKNVLTRRSESKARGDDEIDVNQSLQDEITSVINKLTQYKIRLEKHDLTKKRTCTLGLNGPWAQMSVFIRVTFTFPKDYPQASFPGGTPKVDLERNPLISLKDRAFMLRRLKTIRETHRPCLEACLKFLLFGDEEERIRIGSESSSDDDESKVRKAGVDSKAEEIPYAFLRSDKNLAEPRTSQGVFGPNGELVCFSRAPPRIVRNPLHEVSASPSIRSHQGSDSVPRLFRSPALLSDAITQLTLASNDRNFSPNSRRPEDATNILRIMTNLLTFSGPKRRRTSERIKNADDIPYSLLPTRRSTVFIRPTKNIAHPDRQAASDYMLDFSISVLADQCQKNAFLARKRGRFDHERVFDVLRLFIECRGAQRPSNSTILGKQVISNACTKLYAELCANKDVQMLAMMSVVMLHCSDSADRPGPENLFSPPESQSASGADYFSRASRSTESKHPSVSPSWHCTQPSSTSGTMKSFPSPLSSRGSWSSLFNTGSMRSFMASMQESQGASDAAHHEVPSQFPLPGGEDLRKLHRTTSNPPLKRSLPKSWSNSSSSAPSATVKPASRPASKHPTISQNVTTTLDRNDKSKRIVVLSSDSAYESPLTQVGIDPQLQTQFMAHIYSYADILFRWQLHRERAEIMKLSKLRPDSLVEDYLFGLVQTCSTCGGIIASRGEPCPSCRARVALSKCSVCRLPVKGLSRSCIDCGHITHIKCWKGVGWGCATGCGCACAEVRTVATTTVGIY